MKKIGICLHYGIKDYKRLIEDISLKGYDFIDIAIDHPSMISAENTDILKRLLTKYNIEAGVQTPWEGIILDSSWQDSIDGDIRVLEKCYKFCSKINGKYYNIHIRCDMGSFVDRWDLKEEKIKKIIKSIKKIKNKIKKNIIITTETGGSGFYADEKILDIILEKTKIDICLDCSHTMQYYKGSLTKFNKFINKYKDKIKIMHISAVNKKNIPHFYPDENQKQAIFSGIKKCKNLEYIMFEFFRGLKIEEQIKFQNRMKDEIKKITGV